MMGVSADTIRAGSSDIGGQVEVEHRVHLCGGQHERQHWRDTVKRARRRGANDMEETFSIARSQRYATFTGNGAGHRGRRGTLDRRMRSSGHEPAGVRRYSIGSRSGQARPATG